MTHLWFMLLAWLFDLFILACIAWLAWKLHTNDLYAPRWVYKAGIAFGVACLLLGTFITS